MRGVVDDDARQQRQRQHAGRFAENGQRQRAGSEQGETPAPDRRQGNRAGRNRPRWTMLAIEFRVEGVVQKHAAGVERADAEKEQGQFPQISAAAEPPPGEAVRPDRRQIRHAAQNEQCAELADWIPVHRAGRKAENPALASPRFGIFARQARAGPGAKIALANCKLALTHAA